MALLWNMMTNDLNASLGVGTENSNELATQAGGESSPNMVDELGSKLHEILMLKYQSEELTKVLALKIFIIHAKSSKQGSSKQSKSTDIADVLLALGQNFFDTRYKELVAAQEMPCCLSTSQLQLEQDDLIEMNALISQAFTQHDLMDGVGVYETATKKNIPNLELLRSLLRTFRNRTYHRPTDGPMNNEVIAKHEVNLQILEKQIEELKTSIERAETDLSLKADRLASMLSDVFRKIVEFLTTDSHGSNTVFLERIARKEFQSNSNPLRDDVVFQSTIDRQYATLGTQAQELLVSINLSNENLEESATSSRSQTLKIEKQCTVLKGNVSNTIIPLF